MKPIQKHGKYLTKNLRKDVRKYEIFMSKSKPQSCAEKQCHSNDIKMIDHCSIKST